MTKAVLVILMFFPLLLALGQVFFKRAALSISQVDVGQYLVSLFLSIDFWIAALLYAAGIVFWVWVLQRVPLTIAYVFSALSYVVTPFLAYYFFNETLSIRYVVGVLIIILGIIIATYDSSFLAAADGSK